MIRLLILLSCWMFATFAMPAMAEPIKVSDVSDLSALPPEPSAMKERPRSDWMLDAAPYKAGVYRDGNQLVLSNGLVRRCWRLRPNGACVALDNLMTGQSLLRAVRPEARVAINGVAHSVGGLTGQPGQAFLLERWLDQMSDDPNALHLVGLEATPLSARFPWKQVRHSAPGCDWPPPGLHLQMDYRHPKMDVLVSIHYELYDGLPLMSKWLTVRNSTASPLVVDRFASEILAVVEHSNWVETRDGVDLPRPEALHVETDFAFGGFNHANANRHVVHWRTDPDYKTQVNYLRKQPCLLEVEPTRGPAQDVASGESFESFRAFELVHDSGERERRDLALRRMYRVVAPWVTENPLMMHLRDARSPQVVRQAIDQCAEVGFEMVILSFGSGFNIENEDPRYLEMWKQVADYARSKQVEIGGYSLLSSRRIGGGNDIVSPPGEQPTHGNCPALTSPWGREYFRKLYQFYDKTGFTLLEHDGPYPGDVDVTSRPPYQKGAEDSRWAQWRVTTDFYKWCRGRGVYVNAPDYYYLSGSNKCGMGYRETNWSLPREQQVLHTRQNIFDGTRHKTPSMGWMFVPLTQYHGGGQAATVEPLHEHLDHYERMMASNLGAGVQACYRGPRLYDTDDTKASVKKWVSWYKRRRDILESDVIHRSSRRADGRDLDWLLHANPRLEEKGLLVVYNPLARAVQRRISLDLYYTGLDKTASISEGDGPAQEYELDRRYRVDLPVAVPPGGMTWFVIR